MAVKGCPVENHYTIISSIINKNIACVKLSGGLTGQGSIVVTVVACVQYMAQELLHAAGMPPYPKSIAYINGIGIEMIKNLSWCVYMKTCAQMFIAVSSEKKKKKHNLNVKNYVLFGRHSEDFKPSPQKWTLRLL